MRNISLGSLRGRGLATVGIQRQVMRWQRGRKAKPCPAGFQCRSCACSNSMPHTRWQGSSHCRGKGGNDSCGGSRACSEPTRVVNGQGDGTRLLRGGPSRGLRGVGGSVASRDEPGSHLFAAPRKLMNVQRQTGILSRWAVSRLHARRPLPRCL